VPAAHEHLREDGMHAELPLEAQGGLDVIRAHSEKVVHGHVREARPGGGRKAGQVVKMEHLEGDFLNLYYVCRRGT